MALTSLVSAKMTTKKHCKRRPKFSPSTQQYLIGHLRKRPDFLHGVSLDRDTAAKVTASGASLACAWEADIYTPTYEMKWGPLEPNKEGVWETKNMDQLARWTRVHRKFMRGHAGVWDQELPDWVKQLDGPQNKKALEKAVYDHVYGVMKRYGHQMIAFDVFNEPIAYDNSGKFKDSIFWRNLGYDMFVIAFQAANKAKWEMKSNVKLYLNKMQLEGTYGNNVKRVQAMHDLIKKLRELKVEFQGIGLQGHFNVEDFPNNLEAGIKQWTDYGYETSITELDIRIKDGQQNNEEMLKKQAAQYAQVYDVCLKNPKCKAVIRWNVDDSLSWIPQGIPGWGSATMYGPQCQAKPKIFNAVKAVLAKYA